MTLTKTEWALLGLGALGFIEIAAVPAYFYIGVLIIGVDFLLAAYSQREISAANPPQIAVPTFWGSKEFKVIKPRIVFVFDQFPLYEDLVLIDASKQELEITLAGVRTRADEAKPGEDGKNAESGGSVSVKFGITFEPSADPRQAHDYINSGMRQGVERILRNIAEGATREEGSEHTWEHLTFTKAELSARLIGITTGHQPAHKVKRGAGGQPIRDTRADTPQAYMLEEAAPDEKLDELDYQAFLKMVLVNGYNDVLGLGILIRRFNITEIEPEGDLKKDAERVAREQQQRRAEVIDLTTERQLIRAYMDDANKDLPDGHPNRVAYKEAAQWVRTNRGRAQNIIVESSGNPLADAAAVYKITTPNTPANTEGTKS